MPALSRPRLLPGVPRWALATVAAGTTVQLVVSAADAMPPAGTTGRVLLTLPLHLGAAAVLLWRARRVPHDRDVWLRLALGGATVAGLLAVGIVATLVPALAEPAGTLLPWAPVAAFPFFYGGLVLWNRYSTGLADPDDLLNGISALLAVVAVLALVLHRTGWAAAALTEPHLLPLLAQVAATFVLAGTAASAAFLGAMRRDARPWLVAGFFLTVLAGALATVATGERPAWAPAATAMGALLLTVAAALRPSAAVPRATDPASSTIGAFVVITSSVGVLAVAATGRPVPAAVWCAALAAAGASLRLLVNVRELATLAVSRREALTDDLTGLANRRAVQRRAQELVDGGVPFVFALLDLDRFKEVNDGLGHGAGDDLLRLVGGRLTGVVRAGDLLGRLGGDEFAIVAVVEPGVRPEVTAQALCARLAADLTEPFTVAGMPVHVGASIGVTTAGTSGTGDDPARLLREADAAMYDAKRTGRGWALYDDDVHAGGATTLALVEELRTALDSGQLVLVHQPQVDVATGETVGVEALVRWDHPRRGLLGPADFLPAAEAHGLMGPLTDRVLAAAVTQLARWRHDGLDLRVSVNLSASNLLDTALPQRVTELLLVHGVPAASLVLEVTESVLLSDPHRSHAVLAALRALGVGLSIDDFGTGYCSLAYLRELPVSELKLDRSFTADLVADARTEAIVVSTVELAHRLGLRVVAEGVEDERTLARLAALGCDESQGYLHARPLPAAALETWLAARRVPSGRSRY
ncbi:putative bifunctional diguanylate cyclase/phosphodiesterase [Blastococcus sp. SYSU D00695]